MGLWSRGVVHAFVVLATAASAWPAFAQMQRCVTGSTVYYSDRGCRSGAQDKLGQLGPAPAPREFRSASITTRMSAGAPPRASDHLQYLGAECASISEAIRTAPSRGVGRDVVADLRREYDDKCREDEQAARDKARRSRQIEREQRIANLKSGENARAMAQRENEQCDGMRDVIQMRRARIAQLNELDVAALRRLEVSYNERCVRR